MEKTYLTNRISRINWGAIFAGGLTAIAVSLLLNLLGLGIGLSTIDPLQDANPLAGIGTGSMIWFIISNLIALFCGGWIAGRMAGFPNKNEGALHGFLSWGLYSTVSFMLLGSAISGVTGTVASMFTSKGKEVTVNIHEDKPTTSGSNGLSLESIKAEAFKLLNKGEQFNIIPESTSQEIREKLNSEKFDGEQMIKDLHLDRQIQKFINNVDYEINEEGHIKITAKGDYFDEVEVKEYLAKHTDLTEAEINDLVNNWEKELNKGVDKAEEYYNEAIEKARVYSDKVAEALSKFALYTFFALLLGIIASFFGGRLGSPKHTVEAFEQK